MFLVHKDLILRQWSPIFSCQYRHCWWSTVIMNRRVFIFLFLSVYYLNNSFRGGGNEMRIASPISCLSGRGCRSSSTVGLAVLTGQHSGAINFGRKMRRIEIEDIKGRQVIVAISSNIAHQINDLKVTRFMKEFITLLNCINLNNIIWYFLNRST